MTRRVAASLLSAALAAALAACSDGGGRAAPDTTAAGPTAGPGTVTAPAARPLRVDLIAPAVAELEADLGGPQDYFEINATTSLVNLFLAPLQPGGPVRGYAYVDGELRLEELPTGSGSTFRAAAISIDPERVTERVEAELPTSTPDVFVIEGGPGGVVRYTIVLTSALGGQLVVEVAGTGEIVSVDAV